VYRKKNRTHLWSSLYQSKEAGGTAMASQRKMAVLPKWAGMFFMSVIKGGSGREKNKGAAGIQQLVYACVHREVDPGQHAVAPTGGIHNDASLVFT